MPPLSLEQAESLAPDSGTLNRARKIAKSSKYQNVGQSERAIWGTALGSKAYESYVDLNGPAYKCSCPVKKLPCKHLMGLMLLVAAEPSAATSATPPEALTAWLEKRDGAAQAKATKAAAKASGDGVKDSAAQARRAENREANVQQGIRELKQFLDDIVSNGLLEAKKHKYDAWQQVRRRLIDAQAKGLASQLEQIRLMMGGSGDWTHSVLHEISALHSLLRAWENRDNLPPELADEVRMRIGWNKTRDEVLSQDGLEGDWLIINQQTLYQSDLYSQQIWLLHRQSGQTALLLNFASSHNINTLVKGLLPGRLLSGKLAYYSHWSPQRAEFSDLNIMQQQQTDDFSWLDHHASPDIPSAVQQLQQQRSRLPFGSTQPMLIRNLRLVMKDDQLALADNSGHLLRLDLTHLTPWHLLATLNSAPATLFVTSRDGISAQPWGCLQNNQWQGFNFCKESD